MKIISKNCCTDLKIKPLPLKGLVLNKSTAIGF